MLNWCLTRNILSTDVSIVGNLDPHTASILPCILAKVVRLSIDSSCNIQYFEASHCSHLVDLSVHVSSMICLVNLSECPSLTTLLLHGCKSISTDSLLKSLSGCDNLQSCTISGCGHITERAISELLSERPRLALLEIHGSREHVYNLAVILEKVPNNTVLYYMRTVIASMFATVCGTGVRRLAVYYPLLQNLHLNEATESTLSDVDLTFCVKSARI